MYELSQRDDSGPEARYKFPHGNFSNYLIRNRQLAAWLYANEHVTLERAAELAAMTITEFKRFYISEGMR